MAEAAGKPFDWWCRELEGSVWHSLVDGKTRCGRTTATILIHHGKPERKRTCKTCGKRKEADNAEAEA